MKTGKLMKANRSRKTPETVGIEINYFLSKFFYLLLLSVMLTRGCRRNVVVQQAASFLQPALASQ